MPGDPTTPTTPALDPAPEPSKAIRRRAEQSDLDALTHREFHDLIMKTWREAYEAGFEAGKKSVPKKAWFD